MKGRIEQVNINKIVNYSDNPRHAIGSNEKDTLKKLFDEVGVQYMLNLALDIHRHGFLGCQQITLVYSENLEKYIVYEGNRRVACMKLLKNPEFFDFLDKVNINKIQKISSEKSNHNLEILDSYITDEEEALFIMERVHSGEDKGRGVKSWTSREKDVFRVRQNHTKTLSYLVDFYMKEYYENFDITSILPFTTIQRIFNNREVKKEIGLDVSDESTFTKERMNLVLVTAKWAVQEAERLGDAPTRAFNRVREIENIILPWIKAYKEGSASNIDSESKKPTNDNKNDGQCKEEPKGEDVSEKGKGEGNPETEKGDENSSAEQPIEILLLTEMSIEEGTELYLKRDDIINVPADKVQIIKITRMEVREGDIFKDNNVPGQYIIEYLYEDKCERLNLTVLKKSSQRAKEGGLFEESNQFMGEIKLDNLNDIIRQLYGLSYQKYYLLYTVSFRAIIENMAKEYVIQNGIALSGQLKENVANMVSHLLNKITIVENDPQRQQKSEIHTLYKGFLSLKNFLNSVKERFTTGNYDSLLHSMTHNPSIIAYSFAKEIANEMIIPLYMLIYLIDEKL